MTPEEIRLLRLSRQYLLTPADTQQVVRDLCGVQAQFLSHALHGLSIRCPEVRTDGLVKSWTIRGTMHLFSEADLPLFLHEGRSHFSRPVDTLDTDNLVSASRKAYFADRILAAIGSGTDDRETLKTICAQAGMSDAEAESLFDPWGGIIRALCETGRICHKVQEKKAYRLCPDFIPMAKEEAEVELLRRYFTHFGPATLKDAAYFFGKPQSRIKPLLAQLPVEEFEWNGRSFFLIGSEEPEGSLANCLFLAGFDQLMLGYEKTESLFLPQTHLRDIFTRAGIVRPAILVDGTVAGWWNLKNRKLTVHLFSPADHARIRDAAEKQWPDLRSVVFE
ncbi:MAG: AlkZ family DNA glycosylase [Oscillospiraceae bacterium]|nr:AlkZ family DNA glycosylase [Oscillospiraceae bacterium]